MLIIIGTAALAASAAFATPAPSVYWTSKPTTVNETLLVAGAGLAGAVAYLCGEPTRPIQDAVAWDKSVQLVVPKECSEPPCCVNIVTVSGATVVHVNAPEVWWSMRSESELGPLSPPTPDNPRGTTIEFGDTLRVFGRALAWLSDNQTCINATTPVDTVPTTELRLTGVAKGVVATRATCYEASFDTSELAAVPGEYNASIRSPWGASKPFTLTIVGPPPSPTPVPPLVIDVDADCGGDVHVALVKASARRVPYAVVQLGDHTYDVRQPLRVPNGTTLEGKPNGHSVLAFTLPLPPKGPPVPSLPAALTAGTDVHLRDFALSIGRDTPRDPAHPPYVGVWLPPRMSRFSARGLNVSLAYLNVSNAMRIEGYGFELLRNTLTQLGDCGGYEDHHDRRFQPSVTLYLHGAREGRIAENTIGWRCSAFDLDVSERIVFEENIVRCLDNGTVPHGNSLSQYDYTHHPHSRSWLVARNAFSRPPCKAPLGAGGQCGGVPGADNWVQRETLTTDGSGGWAVGHLLTHRTHQPDETQVQHQPSAVSGVLAATAAGATVQLNWTSYRGDGPILPGTRLLVVDGPGMGQSRSVVGVPANGTLLLDGPLDEHVDATSLLAVVTDAADKLIVGNSFSWSNVIQAYGSTLRYVAADNAISNGNFRQRGSGATGGILGAAGECYHGIAMVFFTEFLRNRLSDSNGLHLRDGGVTYPLCGGYKGPWIRWSVIRQNVLRGASLAMVNTTAPGEATTCAHVELDNTHKELPTTDVVAEHQRYLCPTEEGRFAPGTTVLGDACAHCVVR